VTLVWDPLIRGDFLSATRARVGEVTVPRSRWGALAWDLVWLSGQDPWAQARADARPNTTFTATVAAIAVDTRYRLPIQVIGTGTSVSFSVNGGPVVTKTTNLPAITTNLFPWFGVFNTAGVARVWNFSRAHCRYGS
ncbi:MAG: hypothetical protein AAB368_00085, partial [bacterium]